MLNSKTLQKVFDKYWLGWLQVAIFTVKLSGPCLKVLNLPGL